MIMKNDSSITREEAEAIAFDFVRQFNFRFNVDFVVRDRWKDLYGFDGVGGGAFHSAKNASERSFVTIAANNHKSPEAIERTLKHELLGHYLLNTYPPVYKRAVLIRVMGMQDDPGLGNYWRHVMNAYPDAPFSVQAEEVIARIAQDIDITKAKRVDVDPLLFSGKRVKMENIEISLLDRIHRLKSGELKQQTFLNNDVHPTPYIPQSIDAALTNWRNNDARPKKETDPSNGPRL